MKHSQNLIKVVSITPMKDLLSDSVPNERASILKTRL